MASGTTRKVTGSFSGPGGALRTVKTAGFRPSKVQLYSEGGLATGVWTETMADGDMLKTVTDGTTSFVTGTGISPLSDGFTLGADADLNVADEKVHWEASD